MLKLSEKTSKDAIKKKKKNRLPIIIILLVETISKKKIIYRSTNDIEWKKIYMPMREFRKRYLPPRFFNSQEMCEDFKKRKKEIIIIIMYVETNEIIVRRLAFSCDTSRTMRPAWKIFRLFGASDDRTVNMGHNDVRCGIMSRGEGTTHATEESGQSISDAPAERSPVTRCDRRFRAMFTSRRVHPVPENNAGFP